MATKQTNKNSPIVASVQKDALTNEAEALMKRAGDANPEVRRKAVAEIAEGITDYLNSPKSGSTEAAVGAPIREGVLDGDIHSDIFMEQDFRNNNEMTIPTDLLSPGTEGEWVAFTVPDHGRIPNMFVESDYIMLNTYEIAGAIDCTRKYFRDARYDVLARMIEVLRTQFIKKKNDDAWQTLLAAGVGRNTLVFDAGATAGQFTPRLVSLLKTVMRRNGGGNSSSVNRRKLTDLYMSPEAFEDMTAWNLSQIPDSMRSQIYTSENGSINGLFGVNFHDIDELGVGQEYQNFYDNTLGGSMGASDDEIVLGLDLTAKNKSFIMPVKEDLMIFEDDTTRRERTVSFFGTQEMGFSVLDVRFCLLGSF